MNPIILTAIISITTAIITTALAYYFGLRKKIHDINFKKKRELNVVLADLLSAWEYFETLKSFISYETLENEYLVTWGAYKRIVLHSEDVMKMFENNPSDLLKQSIKGLKQFDGLSFYSLQALNKSLEINKDIINSILENETPKEGLNYVYNIINNVITELRKVILKTSKEINFKTSREIKRKFKNHDLAQKKEIEDLLKKAEIPGALKGLKETIVLVKKQATKMFIKKLRKTQNLLH